MSLNYLSRHPPSCPPHPCPCEVQTNKNPVTGRRRRPRRAQGHRHVQAAPRAARFTRPGGPQRPASGARARGPTSSLERSVIRSFLSRRSQGLQDLGGPEQPPPAWRRCCCNRVPWDSANCERFSGSSSLPGPSPLRLRSEVRRAELCPVAGEASRCLFHATPSSSD